jgi:hypothetical protein
MIAKRIPIAAAADPRPEAGDLLGEMVGLVRILVA